ncbi:hypothetical protein D0869_02090 [Hortaea werneckii]|uniref:Methyltransferase domain-containing protein n=1 Tax=Hortaea werneckii TaxID=91943 RepID=A0A3M6XBC9_HORWE|nr:hypothetical protein KC324_g18776 [Hortaea werneckii]KAI7526211.1 hypothetical protein KC316_g18262 [Hortaea werneckii]RMX87808.1 hypothetical protein D0869_02090 [Hortaea werneckii]RMY14295.1 hypothetical protein D0868_01536 [Hortaea werneckii]
MPSSGSVPQPRDDSTVAYNNRVYSRFSLQNRVYCVPVDESEEERLDELNDIVQEVLDDRIVLVPDWFADEDEDLQVLECGVGKGAWIDSLLEEQENCVVTGVDIYFGQGVEDDEEDEGDDTGLQEYIRYRWNMNAPFAQDRRREEALRPESFDLINSRFLDDGINASRWPGYVNDLRKLLRPDTGWLQMVELEFFFQSDSGMLRYDESEPLYLWQQWYTSELRRLGKDPQVGRRLRALMVDAGFRDVRYTPLRLQIGRWNQTSASLGATIMRNVVQHIESVSLWPFTGAPAPGRMTTAQYQAMLAGARNQLRDERLKLYYTLYDLFASHFTWLQLLTIS